MTSVNWPLRRASANRSDAMRHREATAAGRRSALDVGLGQRQLSRRLLQPPLVQLARRVSQRQVGMIGRRALRETPAAPRRSFPPARRAPS